MARVVVVVVFFAGRQRIDLNEHKPHPCGLVTRMDVMCHMPVFVLPY